MSPGGTTERKHTLLREAGCLDEANVLIFSFAVSDTLSVLQSLPFYSQFNATVGFWGLCPLKKTDLCLYVSCMHRQNDQ